MRKFLARTGRDRSGFSKFVTDDTGQDRSGFSKFVTDDTGQDTVEYALLAALIAIGSIVTIQAIGPLVNDLYARLQTALTSLPGAGG